MRGQKFTGFLGLPLARRALRTIRERGVYAHSLLSVEHQELAKRYVIRGLESGGSVADVGRYVTFAGEDGGPLDYLHPVETIAVNGLHAVVISNSMLRADMLRKGKTYELLITRHWLSFATNGPKPRLECEIVFRGIHGRLELDLTAKDKTQAGRVVADVLFIGGRGERNPGELPSSGSRSDTRSQLQPVLPHALFAQAASARRSESQRFGKLRCYWR
jgi:hypothetical protein